MGGLPERTALILQGGLPLPVIFHALLGYMLGNGRSAPGPDLVRVLRGELEDLHGNRVLTYWGSWGGLAADLMEEMADRGLVTRDGDAWVLTGKVGEGRRVRVMHDVRITPYSPAAMARRENLAYARARAVSYRVFLEEKGLYDGEVRDSFQRHWDSLAWDGDPGEAEEEDLPAEEEDLPVEDSLPAESQETIAADPKKRKRGEISRFALDYAKWEYPRWVTAREAAAAFSEWYPDSPPIRANSAWNRLQLLVWKGLAERKDSKPTGAGPGRNPTLFRWKGEPGA